MAIEDSASALGTLTDIWVLIALIIPGFITFRLLSWIAAYEAKFDQFNTTIYSLICSLFVFIPVSYIFGLSSLDSIRTQVTNPQIMFSLIGFGGLFGILPGIILRKTLRKKYQFGSAWDRFAQEYLSKSVVVYTSDGKEYVGWIKRISRGNDEKKEISLGNPKLVKRKKDHEPEMIEMGEELLFTEQNIKKVLRISPT